MSSVIKIQAQRIVELINENQDLRNKNESYSLSDNERCIELLREVDILQKRIERMEKLIGPLNGVDVVALLAVAIEKNA